MFGCSARFMRLCLLAWLLSIIGLDDAQKVHGASQLTKKTPGSQGSSDGLTTKSSITKKMTSSLAQGQELVTGGQATESKSCVKNSVPAKVFTEGNEKESEENGNVKKKKKKLSQLPVKKGGKNQSTIKGEKDQMSKDEKKSQKTIFSFPTEQHSRPRQLTPKIESNHSRLDSKWSSIRTRDPPRRISNLSIESVRSPEQVTILRPKNSSAHSKSLLRGKEFKGYLGKRNWMQRGKENADMEHDSSVSVISENGRNNFKSKGATNDARNNKNGHWRVLESKKVLITYPNDSQEEIISSVIENPLSSNIASFEQNVKLKKNQDGATDAIKTSVLNSTKKGKRTTTRQLDIDDLTYHIRQHRFGNMGYHIYRWPWHMSVQEANSNGWQHLCYGAVVSRHSVLTNAECVYRKPLPSLRIVRHNIIDKVITLNNSSYIVARVIHPEYKRYLERLHKYNPIHVQHAPPSSGYSHHIKRNNLALLQMRHQFGVDPIHLDNEAHAHRYEMCYTLDHRPVRLISNRECNYYFEAEHIGKSHMCAYGLPCYIHHHHGSPLVCSHPGHRPYLVGLSSYQHSCGHHHPTVYEKIAPYNNWITSNLK